MIAEADTAVAQLREPEFEEFEPEQDQWSGGAQELDALLFPSVETPEGLLGDELPSAAPAPADQAGGGGRPEQRLLFGGYDVWRDGFSAHGAFEWASSAPAEDGMIVRLSMSNGVEHFRTPSRIYTTDLFRASLLSGWRFQRGSFELKLFGGLDLDDRNFAFDVVGAKWRGTHFGARVAADAWAQPLPGLMLASSLYATTIGTGFGFRAATGWRLLDAFWIGPELSGARDEFSRQTRIGLHLTGIAMAGFDWSAAAGYVADSFGRSGLYTRLGASTRN